MAAYTGIEKFIFADMYLFFIKYMNIPDEPYYWDCCSKDMDMLRFKYKNHPFAEMILDSTYSQLRHKVKNLTMSPLDGQMSPMTHDEWEQYLDVVKRTKPFS